MLEHVRRSLVAAWRQRAVVALLYFANVAFAVLFARTFAAAVAPLLEHSTLGSALHDPFDMTVFLELTTRHRRAWSAARAALGPLSVAFVLLHVGLNGVVACAAARDGEPALARDIGAAARRLWSFLALAVVATLLTLVPVAVVVAPSFAFGSRLNAAGHEVAAVAVRAAALVVGWLVFTFCNAAHVQARLAVAGADPALTPRAGRLPRAVVDGFAWFPALGFAAARRFGPWRLYLIVCVPAAALWLVQIAVEGNSSAGSVLGLVAYVLLAQLLLAGRVFFRVVQVAAQASYRNAARTAAGPVAEPRTVVAASPSAPTTPETAAQGEEPAV